MLSDVIKKKRKELGLTLLEIAKYVGVSEATVQRWESGNIKNVRFEKIALLCEILHASPAEIMGWDDLDVTTSKVFPNWTPGESIPEALENIPKENLKFSVRIPVLKYAPIKLPISEVKEIIDYEEISEELNQQGELFGLKIDDDSMKPRFSVGDIVIVKRQTTVEDGDYVVVCIDDGRNMIRQFYRSNSGVKLIPMNPSYDPEFYTNKEVKSLPVRIIGKVVELRAKF